MTSAASHTHSLPLKAVIFSRLSPRGGARRRRVRKRLTRRRGSRPADAGRIQRRSPPIQDLTRAAYSGRAPRTSSTFEVLVLETCRPITAAEVGLSGSAGVFDYYARAALGPGGLESQD